MSGATPLVSPMISSSPSRRRAPLWALAALLWGTTASAQSQGGALPSFELERLELNASGVGSMLMGTGELLQDGDYRLSVTSHYENNPLVLFRNDSRLGAMVGYRATAHLGMAYGLWGRFELSAQLPVVLAQRGDDLTQYGAGIPRQGLALGTPTLAARVKLLSEADNDTVDLAFGVQGSPRLGNSQALAQELRLAPTLMVGRRLSNSLRGAFSAGLMWRPRVILTPDENIQDELGHELRLGGVIASMGRGLRGEFAINGSVPFRRTGYSVETLGGARMPLNPSVEGYAMAGLGFGNAPGTPDYRVLLGVSYGKSAPACGAGGRNDSRVCPDMDGDGDGVANAEDTCPTEKGLVDAGGCVPKDWEGPVAEDTTDSLDGQEVAVAMVSEEPAVDMDGDSLVDSQDSCPDEAGPVDNLGCPVFTEPVVSLQKDRIKLTDTIHFDYNKATIQPRSYPLLDKVARILVTHPEILRVTIEGHTSGEGPADYNRKLSQRRSEAVREYLLGQGVALERMEPKGFGEDRPVQSNATEAGRVANRRVEFITHQQDDAS
ncbi:OmpA family protein [Hyalangium rubrum]|uniref:OmpA family protein n=1 Tax=Hyalangium rubrum TaxID=3103134 RepID=A0ABU5H8F2_9BACT|nr:OmpA family protein [Hyalangium sp. s54d21]MDY7229571.1 OmpA family protein [Hyalangium sp. s54d21]